MKIKSPLKMNDWDIKSFLIVIFSIQLAYLGIFSMNKLGIEIPFLRQILGFVYITFIPGYLLLRILKIHKLTSEESFMYAVGLSLFFDMFVGFLMNMFYPMLGITDKPISEIPIVVTFTLATLLLSIWAYFRDRDYCNPDFINLKDILSSQFLFLSLIPFMAIFGTYLVNYYANNILLMVMIVVIALVVLLVGFADIIPGKLYSYAIWIVAIALIWHITLITEYIPPLDAIGEYIVSETTIINGIWNPSYEFLYKSDIPMFSLSYYNTSLVCAILWPIYSLILKLGLNEIYKIIGPGLYSFTVLATYKVFLTFYRDYQEKFGGMNENKLAGISALLVCVIMPFYRIVPLISKQSIAELFFVLILLSLFSVKKYTLLLSLIFTFSMVISHYSSSFIYLVGLAFGGAFLRLFPKEANGKLFSTYINKQLALIILFGIIVHIAWYSSVATSLVFKALIIQIDTIAQVIVQLKLFVLEFSRGAYILSKESGDIYHEITRFLYLYIQFIIAIGVIGCFLYQIKHIHTKNENNKVKWYVYLGFSIYAIGMLVATIIVPYFAVVDPRRLFHMFSYIIGVFYSLGLLYLARTALKTPSQVINYVKITSIAGIVLLLLFSSGFIYEITKDHPNSISLSYSSVNKSDNPQIVASFYMGYVERLDVISARWLYKYHLPSQIYRVDVVEGDPEFTVYGGFIQEEIYIYHASPESTTIKESYLYLSYPVTKLKTAWTWDQLLQGVHPYRFPYSRTIISHSKIYTNSGSEILWCP
ncbi:DUF2206 domain-containing protein [Thermococcus nautili]|uniref:Putative membrane protein n=1 Tax=Thermococcus nautili TaxID=195522 RepID=W8P2S0_9EURY|nr:DUF2206 domain-containing protein [Thermococcus nautili]AHL23101.1 putative membrane protein [Thermococcus nautili]